MWEDTATPILTKNMAFFYWVRLCKEGPRRHHYIIAYYSM